MSAPAQSCPHIDEIAQTLRAPKLSEQVHREECTLCFDGQDEPEGVLVCLQCFNGGCFGEGRRHAYLHHEKAKHPVGLVVKRTRKEQKKRDSAEPPMKKLAISAPSDEELYSYATHLVCFSCSPVGQPISSENPQVNETVTAIMRAMSSAQQSEVKAWEEEILACEHTLTLEQTPFINPDDPLPTQCTECALTGNLWLCLVCGLAHCGRKQFGGLDGNGHALKHKEETDHAVAVKLGTITPEGTADLYCYACDDAKIDPELATHLGALGLDVGGQSKTEKTMTELNIDHNLKFDFSMTGDDGKELQPVFGEGLTGLRNLGNSCYMASVLQTLFALPAYRERYLSQTARSHQQTCEKPLPAECLECQMLKLADGLVTGRYSKLAPVPPPSHSQYDTPEPPRFQEGIRPVQFKSLIGKGHEEFSTMRQQDSEEFLQHLIDRLRSEAKRQGRDLRAEPTEIMRFAMEQRLQCLECKNVGYKEEVVDLASLPVEAVEKGVTDEGKKIWEEKKLEGCLQALCEKEKIEYACATCNTKTQAEKSTRFKTFPDLLVLHMRKFQLVNWVPTKLGIPVQVGDWLTLDDLQSKGRQAGEGELDLDASPTSSGPNVDAGAVAQLEAMGFPIVRCQKALLATGNNGPDMAMTWLFEHMEDPDIDDPIPAVSSGAATSGPSDEQISMIADMGFSANQARKALREGVSRLDQSKEGADDQDGNPDRAIEWLFSNPDDPGEDAAPLAATTPSGSAPTPGSSRLPATYRLKAFISHKGPSVHSGHYVTTIRQPQAGLASGSEEKEDEWILYNDEKVVRAGPGGGEEMRSLAYLYIYERV